MGPDAARQQLRAASLELARLRRIRGASHRTWRRIARARRRLALAAALVAAGAHAPEPAAALDPVFQHGFLFDGGAFHGSLLQAPALADIDDDGDLDVYVRHDGILDFIENTGAAGTPAFAQPVAEPFAPSPADPVTVTFADLDGDGDLDRFEGSFAGVILFSENTGSASSPAFAARAINPFGLAGTPSVLAFPTFADLDTDGDLDAFVGAGANTIHFENTGTPTAPAFAPGVTNPYGLAAGSTYTAPSFADVDGDGDLDAMTGREGGVVLQENTGAASAPAFTAPVTNPFGLADVSPYGYGAYPAFGDVDGDGDLDALIGGDYAELTAFENTGSITSPAFDTAGNPFSLGTRGAAAILLANVRLARPDFVDIDGDGDLDALIGDNDGRIRLQRNTGTASAPAFAAPLTSPFGLSSVAAPSAPVFADLDGDGDLDGLVGRPLGDLVFFANTGTATAPAFAAPVTNPFGLADVGSWSSPTLGDLDGDGDLDLVVGERFGSSFFFANSGTTASPAFAPPQTNPFGLVTIPDVQSPELVDLDGDGDLDLMAGGPSGLLVFRNTGSATTPAFAAPLTNPFGLVDGGSVPSPAVVDLDGDGDLDALVGEAFGRVLWFENLNVSPTACTDAIDNDGDGRVDLGPGGDPGCASAADTSELGTRQCDNGLDDDGDGKIDFRPGGTGDPQCSGPLDDREAPDPPPGPGCGLGPELLLLAPLVAAERRRRRRS